MAIEVVTRQVHNIGQPLTSPQGKPLAGITLKFTLVDKHCHAISAYDRFTKVKVVGETRVKTNANGEFKVNLWPNTRGDVQTYYLVHGDIAGVERFMSVLVENQDPITLFDFKNLYSEFQPFEYNTLQDQVIDILSKCARRRRFVIMDPLDHKIPYDGAMVDDSEYIFLNGSYLEKGEDLDYTIGEGYILLSEEWILAKDDVVSLRYNTKVNA